MLLNQVFKLNWLPLCHGLVTLNLAQMPEGNRILEFFYSVTLLMIYETSSVKCCRKRQWWNKYLQYIKVMVFLIFLQCFSLFQYTFLLNSFVLLNKINFSLSSLFCTCFFYFSSFFFLLFLNKLWRLLLVFETHLFVMEIALLILVE